MCEKHLENATAVWFWYGGNCELIQFHEERRDLSTTDIWKPFCTALGAEYREYKEIQGSSGLVHPVQAIAVDDVKKRVIIVSAEYNPRIAALMRVDVQATMPGAKVLVARPIAVDLAHAARAIFINERGGINYQKVVEVISLFSNGTVAQETLTAKYGAELAPILGAVKQSGLPIRSHILHTIEQAASIDWGKLKGQQHNDVLPLVTETVKMFTAIDNLAEDRAQGICPVPTYELSEKDWELFYRGTRIEEIQERLKALNIFQYFFPPADSVALAMVDNGVSTEEEIIRAMEMAQHDGHELSKNELLPDVMDVPDILSEFKRAGYIAEGEMSWEMTPEGKSMRQNVKFRPREGLIAKLIAQISVKINLDLKDLLPK